MTTSAPIMTSLWAQRRIRRTVAEQRERVFRFLVGRGEHGATDEEIAVGLGLDGNSVRPRRGELVRLERVHYAERVRDTRAGNKARVWVVDRGLANDWAYVRRRGTDNEE